jgi:hypothetical protein
VVAYRVQGDLISDGVPRSLERHFTSKEDAAPRWNLGHARTPRPDDDDEWPPDDDS